MLKSFQKNIFFVLAIKQSNFLKCITFNYSSKFSENTKSNHLYSILNPYIDFEERLHNNKLQESLLQRNIKIDLDNIVPLWKQYKQIENTKSELENSRKEVAEKIRSYSDPIKYKKEIEGLKVKGKLIRQDLKNLSNVLSDLEQSVLPKIIRLPNDIENNIYHKDIEVFSTPKVKSDHHLDIGNKLNLVKYFSPLAYFLKNEAAEFELLVSSSFLKKFSKHGFVPFSNPDFSRSTVIEGCTINPESLLSLQNNGNDAGDRFYLNGTASLMPFCSFHSKHICEQITVRYVSQGRHYLPINLDQSDGLYSVCQNSSVQIFIGTPSIASKEEFNNTILLLIDLYKMLDLHFRVVKVHPSQLELPEALKVSIQVHSPFKNEFFEVGNLSFYGEYISKKLRIYYKDEENRNFMSIISGTILKIPPLLAAFLENKKDCKIPKNILT